MPAPWPVDDTKDTTLKNLAISFSADTEPHFETAWRLVRGQPGFEEIDNGDDMAYVAVHWPAIIGTVNLQRAK